MSNIAFNWIRRVAMPALTISVALMLPSLPASAGQTDSYTLPQQAYNQSRARDYKVYVPDNIQSPAPMVMALHGCKQTNNDVLNDWGLKAAADQYGFILVAPYITSYDGLRNQNCWGFWFEHHRHQGAGEVEDLHQIALAVEGNYAGGRYSLWRGLIFGIPVRPVSRQCDVSQCVPSGLRYGG